ncbi:FAD-dependent oxidoreductase, partial [Desulfothermus sp.]
RLLPVPGIDRYISSSLLREMKKRKISVSLNSLVKTITMQDNGRLNIAYVDKNKDETKIVECDKVAVCIGRAPLNFDMDLSLELTDSGWIKVDELFRTSNENIYAIGDCLGPTRPMLAHVAMHEAICCVSNIFGKREKMDYTNVPSVVYTNPEIGCVGLTEEMAKQREIDFDVAQVMFRAIGRSHTSGEISGDAKILFDKKSKKILGIHVIGPHASELIGVGCVLLKKGASVEDVEKTIFAHPTLSEIFHELSLKSLSMPIHG